MRKWELLILFNYFAFLYGLGAVWLGSLSAFFLLATFVFAFNFGWFLFSHQPKNTTTGIDAFPNTLQRSVDLTIFVLIGLAAFRIYEFGIQNFLFISRASRSLITSSDLFLSVFDELVIAMILLQIAFATRSQSRLSPTTIFGIGFIVCFGVLTISLATLVKIGLPIAVLLTRSRPLIFYLVFAIAPLLATFWKPVLYSLMFGGGLAGAHIGVPAEITTWVLIYEDLTNSSFVRDNLLGETYIDTVVATLLPFADIEPLSKWYVATYHPRLYELGGGRGFSFFLEGYINFGMLGVFLLGILVGLSFHSIACAQYRSVFHQFLYLVIVGILFKFFRSESYSVFKNLIWLQIIPVVMMLTFVRTLGWLDRNIRIKTKLLLVERYGR